MRVAPLRLRLFAAMTDTALVAAAGAAVVGSGVAAAAVYNRIRGDKGDPWVSKDPWDATRWSGRSRQLRGAGWGASSGLAIAGRNWRSPADRLIGLRRVDAHTGGPVSVRSALTSVLFDQVWQVASRQLFRSRVQREQARLRALAPQLKAIEREHGGDPQGRSRALKEFYESNPVSPAGSCGWVVAGPLLGQLVMALSSREGRTMRDRITGTSVVVDR